MRDCQNKSAPHNGFGNAKKKLDKPLTDGIFYFSFSPRLPYLGFVVKLFNTGTRPLEVDFHDDQKPQRWFGYRPARISNLKIFDIGGFGGRRAVRAVCYLKTGTAKHGEVKPIFLNSQQLFEHLELNRHRWKLVLLPVVPKRDRAAQLYLNLPCHQDHSAFLILWVSPTLLKSIQCP